MDTQVGTPTVSLLPQPAVAAPIEAMRGGGNENVSLLPQPAIPVPIEPMRGGAPGPKLSSVAFRGEVKIKLPANPKQLFASTIEGYTKLRTPVPYPTIPENPSASTLEYERKIDETTLVYFYHIKTIDEYLKIEKRISNIVRNKKEKDFEYLFILYLDEIEGTSNFEIKSTFNTIYRAYLHFLVDINKKYPFRNEQGENEYEIYLLYKKNRKLKFIPQPKGIPLGDKYNERDSLKLKYLEPDLITLVYSIGVENRKICILGPGAKPVRGAINISGKQEGSITQKILTTAVPINTLEKNTYYFDIDWMSHYLLTSYTGKEPEEEQVSLVGFASENNLSIPPFSQPPSSSLDSSASLKNIQTLKQEPIKRIFRSGTEDAKTNTISIDLGEQIFMIRTYDDATALRWKAGDFSSEEKELFSSIGIDDTFLEKVVEPATNEIQQLRIDLKLGRAKFLEVLATTACLKTSEYLLNSECEFMREYLNDLLYVRQMDKIQNITKQLSGIEDFVVQLAETKEQSTKIDTVATIEAIDFITPLLRTMTRRTKTKLLAPFNSIPFAELLNKIKDTVEEPTTSPTVAIIRTGIVPEISKRLKSKESKKPNMKMVTELLTSLDS